MSWMVGVEEEYEAIDMADMPIPNEVVLRVDSAVESARQKSADDFEILLVPDGKPLAE